MSRALDLILTGRIIGGEEALQFGLVNRLAKPGTGNFYLFTYFKVKAIVSMIFFQLLAVPCI